MTVDFQRAYFFSLAALRSTWRLRSRARCVVVVVVSGGGGWVVGWFMDVLVLCVAVRCAVRCLSLP